jgi:hypothetical protein
MAILRELELPDDLYEHLQKLAFTRNSSIEAQALAILQSAVFVVVLILPILAYPIVPN